MKKLIFLLIMLITGMVYSQTEPIPLALRMDMVTRITLEEKNYIKADEKGERVGQLIVFVQPYDVRQTASGQFYVYYTNSRHTEHRKYLGYAWGVHEYEHSTVFFNKDTTRCWIWTVDRYGQLFKMDLPDYLTDDARTIKDTTP